MYDPARKVGKKIPNMEIYDIAPTILNIFGIPIPNEMEGKIIKMED